MSHDVSETETDSDDADLDIDSYSPNLSTTQQKQKELLDRITRTTSLPTDIIRIIVHYVDPVRILFVEHGVDRWGLRLSFAHDVYLSDESRQILNALVTFPAMWERGPSTGAYAGLLCQSFDTEFVHHFEQAHYVSAYRQQVQLATHVVHTFFVEPRCFDGIYDYDRHVAKRLRKNVDPEKDYQRYTSRSFSFPKGGLTKHHPEWETFCSYWKEKGIVLHV